MFRRLLLVCALALGVATVTPAVTGDAVAEAKSKKKTTKAKSKTKGKGKGKAKGKKRVAKVKLCETKGSGKKARRRCSFVKEFQGHGVARSQLRTEPLERPSGDVWLRSPNVAGEARVNIYKEDGSFDEAALATLDELFRCKRTGEVRAVDPRLYEQLSRISDHFGGKQIELVSGFRFAERSSSRHYHASAMDIRITGVGIKEMYAFAESLDGGGMGVGIYPRSGFIHVDYRAPGEPSYRWTDYSGPGSSSKARGKATKKSPGRNARAKKPTS
ncbi:MAG: DUF882 domain-containing protein [Deltaproteobacteria bacterium]|nr:DUF882 domain-containing protein [Kofleriaceae bacterium]